MERAKAERKIYRRLFTLCANNLEAEIAQKNGIEVSALLEKLASHHNTLQATQNRILTLWLDEDTRDEVQFEDDMVAADAYDQKFYLLRQKAKKVLEELNIREKSNSDKESYQSVEKSRSQMSCRRKIKLPKFQLPSFDGQIKNWISFWSHFKKIDEDQNDLTDDDKMLYLLQCMERGTSARDLVESFPPCGENYKKALSQLKERFAKEEFIIEHYVRELLKLIVSKGSSKLSTTVLYDRLMSQILALESLGLTQDKYAAFLYPMVESALPDEILKAWNRSNFKSDQKEEPLSKLLEFVRFEVESEEKIRMAHFSENYCIDTSSSSTAACLASSVNKDVKKCEPDKKTETVKEIEKLCVWCAKSSHTSSECSIAIKMTLERRKEFLKENKACFICLRKGHPAKQCRCYPKCVVCGKRHYTLMCSDLPKPVRNENEDSSEQVLLNQSQKSKTVLLQTLKVNIQHAGTVLPVRALLDSGAQRTFIKSSIAEKLNMTPVSEQTLSHNLFGGQVTKKRAYKVYDVDISSLDGAYSTKITALGQRVLCGYLPKLREQSIIGRLQIKGITLSDCFDDETEISILIGSDVLGSLLTGRTERVDEYLFATETKLGWTLQGPAIGVYCSIDEVNTLHASCTCDAADFWRLETLGIKDEAEVKSQKAVECEVESFFRSTIRVNDEGRYEVRLPWSENCKILEPNYDLAVKRLNSTTTRLSRLRIIDDYDAAFKEWLDCGIIEKVELDDPQVGHYMPHHAVVKESSATTKIRPVFDASATDSNGFSLNSCLKKGVNLIELIPRLIMQFRKNKIGVTADIKKAFLQISLHPQDRDYLKFLWWRDINESPKVLTTFRHRRVVFGVTTSPYLLSATIQHHLQRYTFNNTADLLKKSFYVDNCIVSVDSISEMNHFIEEAKRIMLEGQFELRSWVTGPEIIDEEVVTTSVLGLIWDPRKDELTCKIPVSKEEKLSKRYLLSMAQSIFDPLGFLCPTTIIPKIMIQKCWVANVDWDQVLPEELIKPVKLWLRQINVLNLCRIPRRLSLVDLSLSTNSLHVFCDASQLAYACCIFLRSEYEGEVFVQLVMAKSRVAPTKGITIPRIELLAALLASRLAAEVRDGLGLSCREYYWTESNIVLAWLRKNTGLNIFVSNRVNEILIKTNVEDWRHVPGDFNPADLPSRGCSPKELFVSKWWNGPDWLKRPSTEWPKSVEMVNEVEIFKELVSSATLSVQEGELFSNRLLYFGNYNKIVRTVGWCLRFAFNTRSSSKLQGVLKSEELQKAEKCIFKCLQKENFNDEALKMLKLKVFKDDTEVLRVKTRLTFSDDFSDFIAPILLPGVQLVERLVTLKHKEYLHAGSQTLQAKLRELYWIVGCRKIAKRVVNKCVICKRFSAKSCSAPVPPLPADRVRCGAPFEVTGVDFAGPLCLRSGEKCWIALFTCATYRAIHLETCVSLSTEEFLLALRRFLARRGFVRVIYSDNGTNFQGASNVIGRLDWGEVERRTSKIVWKFIPPAAPWWGGFWERMVRTLKEILRRVLGKAALRFTEFVTVLCEAEAIINSRPLTYIADSTEALQALTPACFLNFSKPAKPYIEIELIDGNILSSRWRYVTKLCADLKQRFRNEYLGLLSAKSDTSRRKVNIKPGDIVLLEVKDRKRVEWPLAMVIDIYEGVDGHERVARVKTASGERLRAVQSIYPLEISYADSETGGSIMRRPLPRADTVCQPPTTTRSGRLVKVPDRFMV